MSVQEQASAPVLAARGLEVRYGRRPVLQDVSFQVRAGQVMALLGRNGSGKTSLVRCLLGQQKPRAGQVLLFGHDAWTDRARAMQRVGVLPEEPDAPPSMSARELSEFCRPLYPRWDGAAVLARLDRFGVPTSSPFARLSRGERGAVMLSLSLGHTPELLVLDDPTLGLDVVVRRAFFEELIGELADRGATVFITSHDLAGLEGLADRVGILHDGRLLLDEPKDALKARFRRLRVPASVAPDWSGFAVVAATSHPWGHEAIVSDFAEDRLETLRARGPASGLVADGLTLEEIFLAVCGQKGAGG